MEGAGKELTGRIPTSGAGVNGPEVGANGSSADKGGNDSTAPDSLDDGAGTQADGCFVGVDC